MNIEKLIWILFSVNMFENVSFNVITIILFTEINIRHCSFKFN